MTGAGNGAGFPVNRPYRALKVVGRAGNQGGHHRDPVEERARELISEMAAYLDGERLAAEVQAYLAGGADV